jgi:hypothetical protein
MLYGAVPAPQPAYARGDASPSVLAAPGGAGRQSGLPPLVAAPPPGPPPKRRPPVGRVTGAAALVGLGLAVVGDRLGWYDLDGAAALALLFGVVGLGMVVGAFIGGGRSLIFPALLLGPLALAAAVLGDTSIWGPIGEREVVPTTVADIGDGLDHGIGQYTVDLRRLEWPGVTVDVPVKVGIGELQVSVPDDVDVVVDATVGAGRIDAVGRSASGTSLDEHLAYDDPSTDRTIHLEVDVGVGHVEVDRVATGAGAR